ncbi:hypothetical protein K0M31_013556, partial [Melipona bicolor]
AKVSSLSEIAADPFSRARHFNLPPFNSLVRAVGTAENREERVDDSGRTNRGPEVGVESLLARPETENKAASWRCKAAGWSGSGEQRGAGSVGRGQPSSFDARGAKGVFYEAACITRQIYPSPVVFASPNRDTRVKVPGRKEGREPESTPWAGQSIIRDEESILIKVMATRLGHPVERCFHNDG